MRILVLFSLILTLVSCEKDCSDGVVSAKANLESLFKNINTANPDLGDLEEALSSYLDTYEDKSCTINKASFHPHEEINSLLAEIQAKKNQVNIKVIYGDDNRVDVAEYPEYLIFKDLPLLVAIVGWIFTATLILLFNN